jgi:hypothetical protein
MKGKFWLTLCCTALLTASLTVAASLPAFGAQPIPPQPGGIRADNLPPPAAAPTKAPMKAPIQAPDVAACAPQTVTCTIMVPHTTYKTVMVTETVCKPELRQKTIQVCRMMPETHMVSFTQTVMVPERRTKTETFTACRMTVENLAKQIQVMVPHVETRQGVKTVCTQVPVQKMITVCKDLGHWATSCQTDCNGCGHSCQVWVPKMVTEQVPVTVYKPQYSQEPYDYQVLTHRPETQTVNMQVPKPVYETQSREVSFYVPVAKQFERQVPRTTLRQVVEDRVVDYTVMVPHQVERQVTVPVCTMVPKQVTYTVPTCAPCGGCGW